MAPEFDQGSSYAMQDYGRMLRRRWPLLLLGLLVGVALAAAALQLRTHTYTSQALVLVSPSNLGSAQLANGRTSGEINLDTEAQLVTSARVAKAAKKLLRVDTPPRDLASQVSVTVPANTAILNIAYTADSAVDAKQGAHAFAQAYLDNRAAVAKAQTKALVQAREDQIQQLTGELQDVTGKLAVLPPNSPELAFDQAQADLLKTQIGQLTGELTGLTASASGPGTIITDAQEPRSPASPSPLIFIAGGIMAGLLLGLFLALLWERLDKRVRRSDVERHYGVPVLATMPKLRHRIGAEPQTLSSGAQGSAPYALLQSSISALMGERQVLLVAPLSSAEAGDQVAANLAAAMASRQAEVVLIRTVGASGSRQQGLPLAAHEPVDLSVVSRSVRRHPALTRLRTIDATTEGSAVRTVLLGRDAPKVLEALRSSADIIIVSVPPLPASADAQAFARLADAALLVVETGRARREAITNAERILGRVPVPIVGAAEFPRSRRARPAQDRSGGRLLDPPAPSFASAPVDSPRQPAGASGSTSVDVGNRQPVAAVAANREESQRPALGQDGDSRPSDNRAE